MPPWVPGYQMSWCQAFPHLGGLWCVSDEEACGGGSCQLKHVNLEGGSRWLQEAGSGLLSQGPGAPGVRVRVQVWSGFSDQSFV